MSLAFFALALARDGMPIENGRFAGGPATVLTLSADQARSLGADRELVLSKAQRAALRSSAGMAPLTLLVYDTRIGENDCCCDAKNRGLRFSADQVEVPHAYLEAPEERGGRALAWSAAAAAAVVVALWRARKALA
jgi:hypothetical protein